MIAKKSSKCTHKNNGGPQQVYVKFPGDNRPKIPDFVICGAGTTSLATAHVLSSAGYRVLMIEAGLDQSLNSVVTKPYASSALNGSGIVQANILNVTLDPTLSSFVGNPSQM